MAGLISRTVVYFIMASALGLGCGGGSGSSGFDLQALEKAAITTALSEQRCVSLVDTGQVICPLAAEVPAGPATEVFVRAASDISLQCLADGRGCVLRMALEVEGTPQSTAATGVVAIRPVGGADQWRLLAPNQGLLAGQVVEVALPVPETEVRPRDGAFELEVAVLFFADRPMPVPSAVKALLATGAQRIFVTKVAGLTEQPFSSDYRWR